MPFPLYLIGINDLGCLGECINLERLDLSGNNITNLACLTSLRLLSVLNLSANRISNLGESLCFIQKIFTACKNKYHKL